jgi:DNA-binding MarR family transcriptional regulator
VYKLTSRQQAFLDQVIALFETTGESVHYSVVADRLGVARSTAYEMMRLLEGKGYLTAEYVLGDSAGPGRSAIVFMPSFRGVDAEWERVRARILSALGQGEAGDQELLQDILQRLPSSMSPLAFCAQVIAALLLNVRSELRSRLGEHELIQSLLSPNLPDVSSLNLLPGFALGLSFRERANRELRGRLVEYTREYQRRLAHLDAQGCAMLQDFLHNLLARSQTSAHER